MSTTATLTNTNVTTPHIPTVNAAFATLPTYTFAYVGAYVTGDASSVAALNALVSNSNTIKNSFNSTVSTYNQSVDAKQQTQEDFAGVYFSDRHIEIYQFLNTDELRSVLIHEMGHALGFEHNPDPHSIMYYEAQSGQVLTDADKQKAKDLCK